MADAKLPPGMPTAREAAESLDEERWGVSDAVTAIVAARDDDWRQRIADVEADNARLRAELAAAREALSQAAKFADARVNVWRAIRESCRDNVSTLARHSEAAFFAGKLSALASRTTNTEGM